MPYQIVATRTGYVAEVTTQASLDEVETWIATYAHRTIPNVSGVTIARAIATVGIVGHARVYRLRDTDVEFIVTLDSLREYAKLPGNRPIRQLTAQEFLWISPAARTAIDAPVRCARIDGEFVRVVIVEGPTQAWKR